MRQQASNEGEDEEEKEEPESKLIYMIHKNGRPREAFNVNYEYNITAVEGI